MSHFFSRTTRELVMSKCSEGSIPISLDDPFSKRDIQQLVIDLLTEQDQEIFLVVNKTPKTTVMVTANFNLETEK